jgi:hypothetical protein
MTSKKERQGDELRYRQVCEVRRLEQKAVTAAVTVHSRRVSRPFA